MKKWSQFFVFVTAIVSVGKGNAQQSGVLTNETEASIVQVDGNTQSESYSAKQKTAYAFDLNSLVLAGRYLQTKSAAIETARSWDVSLRFERSLSERWSVFVQQSAESDPYSGYTQRDNTDLGGKYFFLTAIS
jgi:hypothetical protein